MKFELKNQLDKMCIYMIILEPETPQNFVRFKTDKGGGAGQKIPVDAWPGK